MLQANRKSVQSRLKLISEISAIILGAIGILVIVGWLFDIPFLKSFFPGCISMKFNTALCFVLSAIALWMLDNDKPSALRKIILFFCLFIIGLISSINLYEYFFQKNIGIDELFMKDDLSLVETLYPGRLAPITACNFLLAVTAFSIIFLKVRNYKIAHSISLFLFATSLFSICGYLYGAQIFYNVFFNTKMAVHTSLAFFVLSIGLLTAQGDKGIISFFTSDTIGGTIARRLIPLVIFLTLFLGWLQLQGEKYGWYESAFGVAFFNLINIGILVIIIFWSVKQIILKEEKQKKTEQLLKKNSEILASKNIQLTDFCNIVSHNLRGPLVNISMLIDFIESSTDKEERNELLGKFKPVINSLNENFNELVESLQVRNDHEIITENIIIRDSLKKILDGMEAEINKYKASFEINLSEAPIINFPPKYLNSILFNLISNSLKYKSPERNPVIKIKTEKINDTIVLSVTDNGLGIDLRMHKKNLFKIGKVFHEHQDAKGFGLFMTKTQVEAMGGKIWAESTPGEGSTFSIEFKNQNL